MNAAGVPDQDHLVFRPGRAEPFEFTCIETHALPAQHLVHRHGIVHRRDGGAVLRSDRIHEIGGQHVSATGHVLHDDVRLTGNEPRHVARDQSRRDVVGAARPGAGDDGDRLALVESLGMRRHGDWQGKKRGNKTTDHRRTPENR